MKYGHEDAVGQQRTGRMALKLESGKCVACRGQDNSQQNRETGKYTTISLQCDMSTGSVKKKTRRFAEAS